MANDWKKFMHKTMTFTVKTNIECGSFCNAHGSQCDIFAFIDYQNEITCSIGTFSHHNPSFLSSVSGEHNVHMNMGKHNANIAFNNFTTVIF